MGQTYHIEAVGFESGGGPPEVIQRLAVRSDALEAVRILDGAGSEVFRWTVWDDMSAPRR